MMWPFNEQRRQRRLKRIARGAAILDAARPGWAKEVDPSTLRMAGEYRCVLGQLYGSYGRGISVLAPGQGEKLGFSERDYRQYDDLDRAWAEFIRERQKVPA